MNEDGEHDDERAFAVIMAGTAFLGAAAAGIGILAGTPIAPQIKLDINDALIGFIAALPMVVLLWLLARTDYPSLAKFRDEQIEFFADIGFRFTPMRIGMMAVGAGVCEELLFRGVMQTWLDKALPIVLAILISNVVFGLLHMRTAIYAVIAGLIGVYLGALYAWNGNLLTPIVTHIAYDAVALEYTRRAITNFNARRT